MIDSLLASFASAFTQDNRLLKLHFAPGSGMAEDAILPHRLTGAEHLSQCYRYDLDCLSANGMLELKDLLGLPVQVDILQADGDTRVLTGLVTAVEQRGSDGGFSRFGLMIEPALAVLTNRVNSRVFQEKSVPDIVQTILDEHIAQNPVIAQSFRFENHLTKTYPSRSYCLEYRESDKRFLERILAEEGISYYFKFENTDSQGNDTGDETPIHTLILFDDVYLLDANVQERVRFHRSGAAEEDDTITDWQSSRQIQSGKSTLASFDYKRVSLYDARSDSIIRQGDAGQGLSSTLEHYEPQTLYYGVPALMKSNAIRN